MNAKLPTPGMKTAAAAVFLVTAVLGWNLAERPAVPESAAPAPDGAVSKASKRTERGSGRYGTPGHVREAMKRIREAGSTEARMRATIELAGSLPASEIGDWLDGRWFDTQAEAESHAQAMLDEGRTNLDIGCFQLNIHWHSKAFTSLEDMIDPVRNAGYAAEYLVQHYAQTGDWALAAARYHSATPEHAERYRVRFEATLASLESATTGPLPTEPSTRENSFPLLVAGSTGQNGSLVPQRAGGSPLIGGN